MTVMVLNLWRQGGRVVRESDLRSGGPWLRSHSEHLLVSF